MAEDVKVVATPRIVGTNHFVTTFCQNGGDKIYDAIGFNLGKFVYEVDKDIHLVDIVFTIEKVVREGRTYPQIRVKDIIVKNCRRRPDLFSLRKFKLPIESPCSVSISWAFIQIRGIYGKETILVIIGSPVSTSGSEDDATR